MSISIFFGLSRLIERDEPSLKARVATHPRVSDGGRRLTAAHTSDGANPRATSGPVILSYAY